MNSDCPIRKQEEHKKCMMENVSIRGKVADSDVQTRVLENKVQFRKDIGAAMAALPENRPDSHDATSRIFKAR